MKSPAVFNQEASKAYHELSVLERDNLKEEACKEVKRTQREVLQRGEKIFHQIQQMICNGKLPVVNWKSFTSSILETQKPFASG